MKRLLRLGWLALAALATLGAEPKKIVFLGDMEGLDKAVELGVAETEQQAGFLGIELVFAHDRDPAHAPQHADAAAVIIHSSPEEILWAAEALGDVPVFNVGSRDDALRTRCRPNLFHVIPSDKMLADAEAQWRQGHPSAKDVRAQAWHPAFVKFAARDLNNRYEKGAGVDMSDDAWAVWAAYRLVGTAIVNNPEASPAELETYFREDLEFDAQKGVFSTFRETGQMRQALLIVADGDLAGEAPVRGVADSDDLDSLGLQECKP